MTIKKSRHTPCTRLVLQFLEHAKHPQTYFDVVEETGVSYWTARLILKSLVTQGLLKEEKQGPSPVFSLVSKNPPEALYRRLDGLVEVPSLSDDCAALHRFTKVFSVFPLLAFAVKVLPKEYMNDAARERVATASVGNDISHPNFLLEDDMRGLWCCTEKFPPESFLAFVVAKLPEYMTGKAFEHVAQARADEAVKKGEPAPELPSLSSFSAMEEMEEGEGV